MASGGLAFIGEMDFVPAEDAGCFAAEDGVVVMGTNDGRYTEWGCGGAGEVSYWT